MRRTILLADDSPTIHRLVTSTFADADFEIVSVSNGDAAVRKFEEIHPHVVLADIYMPGKTGYEVCTYVRQHPTVGNTPVILLVGAFDVFDEDKAHEIGANGHITKPFEPQALFSMVESVLPPEEETTDDSVSESSLENQTQTVIIAPAESAQIEPAVHPEAPSEMQLQRQPEPEAPAPPSLAPQPIMEVPPVPASLGKEDEDLLGLESLFPNKTQELASPGPVSDVEIDRIANRVMQRLSTEVIESIVWEVVPDIAEKIVREELKRKQ